MVGIVITGGKEQAQGGSVWVSAFICSGFGSGAELTQREADYEGYRLVDVCRIPVMEKVVRTRSRNSSTRHLVPARHASLETKLNALDSIMNSRGMSGDAITATEEEIVSKEYGWNEVTRDISEQGRLMLFLDFISVGHRGSFKDIAIVSDHSTEKLLVVVDRNGREFPALRGKFDLTPQNEFDSRGFLDEGFHRGKDFSIVRLYEIIDGKKVLVTLKKDDKIDTITDGDTFRVNDYTPGRCFDL